MIAFIIDGEKHEIPYPEPHDGGFTGEDWDWAEKYSEGYESGFMDGMVLLKRVFERPAGTTISDAIKAALDVFKHDQFR
jgi:hypothetical protein